MGRGDRIDAAVALIEKAAFDPALWDEALRAVAAATGSRFGQLIAIGPGPMGAVFNRLPDVDADFLKAMDLVGGHRPDVNSRIRIGAAAPAMLVLDETSFTTEADRRLNPAYGDLIAKADIPFICLTNLIRTGNLHVGMAVLRGEAQGNIGGDERRAFDLLAVRMQQSVRMTLMMGAQSAAAAMHGLEATDMAAFVCDKTGVVLTMTPQAEALLSAGGRLTIRGGRLVDRATLRDLSDHVAAVGRNEPPPGPVFLPDSDGGFPLVMEFAPLPSGMPGFPGTPGVLAIVRRPWSGLQARLEGRVVALHGLTPREAEVALGLCQGLTPQAVAQRLGMGLGTVRTHVRHLFDKTGATTLAQLVARLRAYD